MLTLVRRVSTAPSKVLSNDVRPLPLAALVGEVEGQQRQEGLRALGVAKQRRPVTDASSELTECGLGGTDRVRPLRRSRRSLR